jgi:hypothetical protein
MALRTASCMTSSLFFACSNKRGIGNVREGSLTGSCSFLLRTLPITPPWASMFEYVVVDANRRVEKQKAREIMRMNLFDYHGPTSRILVV